MSKTIETLKKASFKEDVLRNHIADTYFSQKPAPKTRKKKSARPPAPVVTFPSITLPAIKVEPILKAATAACLVFATLAAASIVISYVNKERTGYLKRKVATLASIPVFVNGAVNRELIEGFDFRGHAKNRQSRVSREGVVFTTPEKYKWADLSIFFRVPIDVSSKNLRLSMRGEVGGERINIVLRDTHNRSYRIGDVFVSSGWTNKVIPLDIMRNDIDISGIDHIRIECGYIGESVKDNDPRVDFRIYLKDINISKESTSPINK
jgi:hypothetical protein